MWHQALALIGSPGVIIDQRDLAVAGFGASSPSSLRKQATGDGFEDLEKAQEEKTNDATEVGASREGSVSRRSSVEEIGEEEY